MAQLEFKLDPKQFENIKKALKRFPEKLQRRALRSSMLAAGRVVAKTAKSRTPSFLPAVRRNIKTRTQPKRKRTGEFAFVVNVGVEHGRIRIKEFAKGSGRGLARGRGRRRGQLVSRKLTRRERDNEDPFYWHYFELGWIPVGRRQVRGGRRARQETRSLRALFKGSRRFRLQYMTKSFASSRNGAVEAFRRQMGKQINKFKADRL